MSRCKSIIMFLGVVMLFATSAFADQMHIEPRIASFDIFIDQSGSMMMSGQDTATVIPAPVTKIEKAKDVVTRVIKKVPNLGYKSSMHTFAPYSERKKLGAFDAMNMKKAVSGISADQNIRGRYTPMGDGLNMLKEAVAPMPRDGAVIIVSDGQSNKGTDPVAQAKAMYDNTEGICLHVVSLADTAEGEATLKQIAALDDCSVYAEAATLMNDEKALDTFVRDVFYRVAAKEMVVKTKPAPKAPMVEEEEIIVLRNINFAFDSAELSDDSKTILDEAVLLIEDRKDMIVLTGHTDSTGPEAYNMALSKRRADSVRAYFIQKGIPEAQLMTRGMGESQPEASNQTAEGRKLNRRVEISFK